MTLTRRTFLLGSTAASLALVAVSGDWLTSAAKAATREFTGLLRYKRTISAEEMDAWLRYSYAAKRGGWVYLSRDGFLDAFRDAFRGVWFQKWTAKGYFGEPERVMGRFGYVSPMITPDRLEAAIERGQSLPGPWYSGLG